MDSLPAAELCQLVTEPPQKISSPEAGVIHVDFGRVAFGNLRLRLPETTSGEITVHLGEASTNGRIDRQPPGSVRYAQIKIRRKSGEWQRVCPEPDARNTGPQAVPLPREWGVILPFRWVEIEGWPNNITFDAAWIERSAAFATSWDDSASAFSSSDPLLDRVWELCRYSIKATTFAGVYVDGDRERIPYEADAFVNQLSHYACDPHPEMARATFDWLMRAPTWPTEWAAHMVFMAHADWMFTCETDWVNERFESLKTKLLPDRERADGLIASNAEEQKLDIVDWPWSERDGYEFTAVNTVVNAFQYRALALMAELAQAIGRPAEASHYQTLATTLAAAYQKTFFDPTRGIYRDGEGTDHASQHANIVSLAFGLVPKESQPTVIEFIKSRGMACSVYMAQYLFDALLSVGESRYALELMLSPGDRSWRHMVESGTTITWEAWDQSYKPNQDWNHAWGAAPANLLPRFILGVQPLEPGYGRIAVRPQLGNLSWAEGRVPTLHGPVHVRAQREASGEISVEVQAPAGVTVVKASH